MATPGGAALSLKAVMGKPIKFVGVGEKVEALEVFHPDRMATRISGMGDIISLVEKAQATVDEQQAHGNLKEDHGRMNSTLEDFRNQLLQIKKMGSLKDIFSMIPGMNKIKALKQVDPDDKELVRVTAIIDSMTKERQEPSPDRWPAAQAHRPGERHHGPGRPTSPLEELWGYEEDHEEDDFKEGMKALRREIFPFK